MVARGVAVAPVDLVELLELHERDHERAPVAGDRLRGFVQRTVAAQQGQRVRAGQLAQRRKPGRVHRRGDGHGDVGRGAAGGPELLRQRADDARLESGADTVDDLLERILGRACGAVRTIVGHRGVRVDHGQHAGGARDGLAGEPRRVPVPSNRSWW